MRLTTSDVTTMGVCIAVAVAAGYALLHVPNVELITTISFLSGLILGSLRGLTVGALSMLIFSLFNPLGIPFFPVLIAQVLFMGLPGLIGGLWRRRIRRASVRPVTIVGLAGTGLIITLLYDVATNVGFALSAGLMKHIFSIVAAGMAFSLLHVVTNTLLFATVVPAAIKALRIDQAGPRSTGDTQIRFAANENHE